LFLFYKLSFFSGFLRVFYLLKSQLFSLRNILEIRFLPRFGLVNLFQSFLLSLLNLISEVFMNLMLSCLFIILSLVGTFTALATPATFDTASQK